MSEFKPGKGIHASLDQESLEFFQLTIEEIWNAFDEDSESEQSLLDDIAGSASGWKSTKDKFGKKLYKAHRIDDDNEIRITVVLKDNGEYKIDVRNWFRPE